MFSLLCKLFLEEDVGRIFFFFLEAMLDKA